MPARFSADERVLLDGRGGLGVRQRPRVGELVAGGRRAEGHQDRRPAGGGTARRRVIAPARQTTRSAQAISSWSAGRNGHAASSPPGIRRIPLPGRVQVLLAGLVDHLEAGLLQQHGAAPAMARLMTREPWLPPKTSSRRVRRRRVERRDLEELRRTGVPVTTPGAEPARSPPRRRPRCASRSGSGTGWPRPAVALDSWITVGIAERPGREQDRDADVAAHPGDRARPEAPEERRASKNPCGSRREGGRAVRERLLPAKPDASTSSRG